MYTQKINALSLTLQSASGQLRQREDDLERLNAAHTKLRNYQKIFIERQTDLSTPMLPSKLWRGKWSDGFSIYRRSELRNIYLQIPQTQLKQSLSQLKQKIDDTRLVIDNIDSKIHRQTMELQVLKEKQRKEPLV